MHATRDRGLLHDLGHGLATLSCLAAGLHDDPELPVGVRQRMELLNQEISTLIDLVRRPDGAGEGEVVPLRELLGQLADLAAACTRTRVCLRPGEEVDLRTDRGLLWRMVANLVDNAIRAAGPAGTVEIGIEVDGSDVVIDVLDNGPGFGSGPPGSAGLGLGVVTELADRCAASLRVEPAAVRGTRARLIFRCAARR